MVKTRSVQLAIVSCCLAGAPLAAAEEARGDATAANAGAVSARQLFERGIEAVHREAWAEAEAAFEQSARIVSRPSTLYNLALSRYRLERHVEALEAVELLLNSGDPADASTREHAETLRQRALERVVTVEVTVEPPDATISVDGSDLQRGPAPTRTLHLVPGSHVIIVSAVGRVSVRLELEGKPGQTLARSVALATVARVEPERGAVPAPPPPPPVAAPGNGIPAHWVLMGAGSLLLAGAAVTGAIAWKLDGDFMADCPSNHDCDPRNRSLQQRAATFANAAGVLLGLGLATGGVGAVLYWKSASSSHDNERAMGVMFQGSL